MEKRGPEGAELFPVEIKRLQFSEMKTRTDAELRASPREGQGIYCTVRVMATECDRPPPEGEVAVTAMV